tara:strand:+ start:256 stop:909 length:654 start_codon:yes stop_codon:yes gene_type:complete
MKYLILIPLMMSCTVQNINEEIEVVQDKKEIKTISTIGDSRFVCCGSGNVRNELSKLGDYEFVGNLVDTYGLNHDAIGGNNTFDLLERYENIPTADLYVIHYGTNDPEKWMHDSIENMKIVVQHLLDKGSLVLYAYQTERNDDATKFTFTDKHYELDSAIHDYFRGNDNFYTVDLRDPLLNSDGSFNWHLYSDFVHPNEVGGELMAKAIHEAIVSIN